MRVIVNDLERSLADGQSLLDLLEADGEPVGHVLVEVNGKHLFAREYATRILADGDRVEIILPAFGG